MMAAVTAAHIPSPPTDARFFYLPGEPVNGGVVFSRMILPSAVARRSPSEGGQGKSWPGQSLRPSVAAKRSCAMP